ncbi:MAG: methyltransferase [Lentisphaeraceae bacterium]|nr:methyltransferase [Lentisphaeraceae bacterium]
MKNTRPVQKTQSFEQLIKDSVTFEWNANSPEPLAHLDYDQECELKNSVFAKFLKTNGINLKPEDLLKSPKPRHYRTTTKRRVFCEREGIGLGFANPVKAGVVSQSLLEPETHQKIYSFLQETLSAKSYSSLARALNWLIIRGTYERQFLILNIFKMDGNVVRKLKQICEVLQKEKLVEGALSYFDPSRSDYYLEVEKPPRGLQIKHLFGPKLLGLKVNDTLMRYSPTGFSQVNESIVPTMINEAQKLLNPESKDVLLDLYCGYGLFSHTVGSSCKKVTGVELSSSAIESAREISKRLKTNQFMKFYSEKINATLVKDKFEPPAQRELVLLDPPRNGCEPGVINELAKREPKKILHIFCGTDEIPGEIKQWQKNGYEATTIQPLDMFAGSANLETMVLLERK